MSLQIGRKFIGKLNLVAQFQIFFLIFVGGFQRRCNPTAWYSSRSLKIFIREMPSWSLLRDTGDPNGGALEFTKKKL